MVLRATPVPKRIWLFEHDATPPARVRRTPRADRLRHKAPATRRTGARVVCLAIRPRFIRGLSRTRTARISP